MPRKSRLTESIERAMQSMSKQVMKQALGDMPRDMSMGAIIAEFEKSEFAGRFAQMTLGDFAEVLGGGASVPRSAGPKKAAKAKKTGTEFNTRTLTGRAQLRDLVIGVLSKAGTAGAQSIRGEVGGTSAQVRECLTRMLEDGTATKQGEKRGTRYTWVGEGRPEGKKRGRRG